MSDSFTCGIAHAEGEIAVLDCLLEIPAPFNPTTATGDVARTLKSYELSEVVGDRYAARWIVDAFSKHSVRYTHSERDRSAIYADALPLFTSGRVRLLDNRKLVAQIAGLERRTASFGRDRIDHPAGGHDDLSNSAAGALVMLGSGASNTGFIEYYRQLAEQATGGERTMVRLVAPSGMSHVQLRSGRQVSVPADRLLEMTAADARPLRNAGWTEVEREKIA